MRRELRFLDELPASALGYGDSNGGEKGMVGEEERIAVQGIADCVFLEDGRWYIVDYKTDAVREPQALLHQYGRQLELYARILSRSFAEPVGGCILYPSDWEGRLEVDVKSLSSGKGRVAKN